MILRNLLSIAFAALLSTAAIAQQQQFGAGQVLGNSTAAQRPGRPEAQSAILDRAVGSTRGSIMFRGVSAWSPATPGTAGLPWISNGAGADPTYQTINPSTAYASQTAGNVLAAPAGSGGTPSFRLLVGSDLPNPGASSKGGVQSLTCGSNTWFNSLSTGGVLACTQPSFASLTGSLTCAQTPALTGDATTSAGSCATTLATVNSNVGSFGSGTLIPVLTVDGKGRITAASTTAVSVSGGAWSNTRLAKTAAYPAVTGDCSDTLALGGTAFFAVTFNAPSGYTATCGFLVLNEDRTRGKMILPQFASSASSITIGTGAKVFTTAAGLTVSTTDRYRVYSLANNANWMAGTASYTGTTFTLTVDTVGGSGTFTDWQIAPEIQMPPFTQRWVYNQNNVWKLSDPQRWLTPGRGIIYELCVVGGGSDSNDGFGTGSTSDCLATPQTAVNRIGTTWDGGGYNACAIGLYAGNYGTVSQTGSAVGCYLTFNVRGTLSMTGTGACFSNGDGSIAIWNWNLGFVPTFKCNTANSAGTGAFYSHQTSIYDFNGGTAVWIPGGVEGLGAGGTKGTNDVFFYVDLQGSSSYNAQVNVGNGTDTFNPLAFVFAEGHASQITLSGTIAFNPSVTMNKALVLQLGSLVTHTATWLGASVTNATAVKGGAILVQSSTVPGPAATATSPGVICATKAC